ncbi:GUN4 domain-containing protein [Microcoleus sp. herbarium14]|uniref:GUN4 domain-containing protein n=1 Tax=Microcoleus sp. herbarium14 TaxID=3055439 RepID=UPI002FD32646
MKSPSCWLIFTLIGLSLTSCSQPKSPQEIQATLQQAVTKVDRGVQINTFRWGIPIKTYLANESNLTSQPIAKANYTKLEQLLAAGKWKEADEETYNKMLEVAGKQQQGHAMRGELIVIKDIENFSCPDLRAMDGLWVKYSNGRFGFSVQKRIYQNLGGTKEFNGQVLLAYFEAIGWKQKGEKGKWLPYSQLTFNTNAPSGHLPAGYGAPYCVAKTEWEARRCGERQIEMMKLNLFFSRAETCKV